MKEIKNKKLPEIKKRKEAKQGKRHPEVDTLIKSKKYTSTEIATMIGYNKNAVNTRARKLGIKLPLPWYKLNHGIFKERSPRVAWLIGLIAADGCINYTPSSNSYRLSFHIHKKDKELFKYINKHMESDKPIYKDANGKHIQLQYSSKEAFEDLSTLGITPRKSLKLKWINLGPTLTSHFVRGYFDGDGSVSHRGGQQTITFAGTLEFLSGLRESSPLPDGYLVKTTNKNTWQLIYYCDRSKIITDWMYKGSQADTRLARKYNKCQNPPNKRPLGRPKGSKNK